ncbi:LacI family transcriptional regulator [Pseudoclavibacter sp. RFBG4]|uniref:LacI family DNA-binding transcriptional regulator n=1 Tax=Pseudoclavibacter sp. RFBG4 TaxID=2080575 RepID=UPI000CE76A73|nr:LacI family DNA-binding transcriptional regulator [Pseudoclavibacter sp. RFBG4]PPG28811.1 LacI family transcriptional regulator [Pseudoclavibacter sp. RFBG4]
MAATLHDVARVAGVSIKTVSNVIHNYPHIRANTKQRVLDAINEVGYRPNLSARGLRLGRTGVISLVIPDLRNAYFSELAEAVMRAAAEHELSVLIEQSGGSRESEIAALKGPRAEFVDGILFSVLELGAADASVLADVRVPMVLLGERIFNGPTDHVTMRNTEGTRAATEHLIEVGCTRIIALGSHPGEEVGSAALRTLGYRQALEAAGLPFREELVRPVGTWHRFDGAAAMREVLADGVEFDGIVGFNDSLALGAMRVLSERGIRMPEDVAVVGFDDIDETRYSLPTLTTIAPGREEVAKRAVEMLVERMGNRDAALEPRELLTEFTLVRRESTAR